MSDIWFSTYVVRPTSGDRHRIAVPKKSLAAGATPKAKKTSGSPASKGQRIISDMLKVGSIIDFPLSRSKGGNQICDNGYAFKKDYLDARRQAGSKRYKHRNGGWNGSSDQHPGSTSIDQYSEIAVQAWRSATRRYIRGYKGTDGAPPNELPISQIGDSVALLQLKLPH